jgi:hypothetical protein
MITLKSYLESGNWPQNSFALYSALENIENSCSDVYKLNDIPSDYYSTDIFERLQTAVQFVKDAIDLIGKQQNLPSTTLRVRSRGYENFYDHVANLMFKIILSAASVTAPDKYWDIHYNSVWDKFFGISGQGKAWKIIHLKLRRLLYDEILQLKEFPNYKSSKILGFCLNVMGLKIRDKKGYYREYYPLHKAVLAWTRNNYLRLKSIQTEVANSCLIGSINFDEQGSRLVKTYAKGLNLEAPKDYLDLASANNEHETDKNIQSIF